MNFAQLIPIKSYLFVLFICFKRSYIFFREPKILKRTMQCCAFNGGVFWASLLLFEVILLPFLKVLVNFLLGDTSSAAQQVWFWMKMFLSWTFGAIWVLPLFLLSKIVNSLWFMVCTFQ